MLGGGFDATASDIVSVSARGKLPRWGDSFHGDFVMQFLSQVDVDCKKSNLLI